MLHPDPIRMVASALEDDLCGQPKNCVAAVRFPLRPEITQGSLVIRSPLSYQGTKSAVILSCEILSSIDHFLRKERKCICILKDGSRAF